MAVGDAHVFPGFLTPVPTQLLFPKPPTTFLTCFCRGERRKYAGKKSRLNRGSNSQPPGHESDTLTTEPPGWGSPDLNPIEHARDELTMPHPPIMHICGRMAGNTTVFLSKTGKQHETELYRVHQCQRLHPLLGAHETDFLFGQYVTLSMAILNEMHS